MNRALVVASLIGSFLIYGAVINLYDSLLMLMFFGVLPGGSGRMSADQMLLAYGVVAAILGSYAARRIALYAYPRLRTLFTRRPVTTRRRARA